MAGPAAAPPPRRRSRGFLPISACRKVIKTISVSLLLLLLLSEAQQHKCNFCSIKLWDKNKIKEGLTAVLYFCRLKLEPEVYRHPFPPPHGRKPSNKDVSS